MTLVIVPGTFDGVHNGHRELFDFAKKISGDDEVWVLVNSDDMIRERKPGIQLLMNENDRCTEISKSYPDFFVVTAYSINELLSIYEVSKPIVVHGDDYDIISLSELYNIPVNWWVEHGVLPVFCHRNSGVSSTLLRNQKNKEN